MDVVAVCIVDAFQFTGTYAACIVRLQLLRFFACHVSRAVHVQDRPSLAATPVQVKNKIKSNGTHCQELCEIYFTEPVGKVGEVPTLRCMHEGMCNILNAR